MKRNLVVSLLAVVVPALLFAWGGSVSTSWNGSNWVDGETTVLAGTSAAYLTLCSPGKDQIGVTCPSAQYHWWSQAKFERPAEAYFVQRECGGNDIGGPYALGHPNQNYILKARFASTGTSTPPQSAGPVQAIVTGGGPTNCQEN
ncbi:hypothetical protein HZB60_09940 [candidate division KSB1 bacterium]|nr:hypothetical protein [candidate division KSB1 bacterium]